MVKKLSLNSELFTRGVVDIITQKSIEEMLARGKPLRIKHGIDATAPDLHVGHATSLWKLREFQEAGHKAVILFGDITTQIGDPTGKTKPRPQLEPQTIAANIRSIKKQIEKILLTHSNVLEFRKSSEWYGRMKTPEFLKVLSFVTHARLLERDMFHKRIEEGGEIFMHEFIYPILQGYDSVMLHSDLTVIGSDQLFNEHMGRMLQEKYSAKPQAIIALKILPGLDGGEKMSKSLGNYISLADTPRDMFGKAMRIKDELILPYLEIYTDTVLEEIKNIASKITQGGNPMEAKLYFAKNLVRRYHGKIVAEKEREKFLKMFSEKNLEEAPRVNFKPGTYDIIELLLGLTFAESKSDARRLITQEAVEIDGKIIKNPREKVVLNKGTIVRVGKKRFAKID